MRLQLVLLSCETYIINYICLTFEFINIDMILFRKLVHLFTNCVNEISMSVYPNAYWAKPWIPQWNVIVKLNAFGMFYLGQ